MILAILYFLFSILAALPAASPEVPVPVRMDLPISIVVLWITSIAIGLGGLVAIARFIGKASTIIADLKELWPVIIEIAKEFQSDSGSTLKDSINRIEKSATEAKAAADLAKAMAENLSQLLIGRKNENE